MKLNKIIFLSFILTFFFPLEVDLDRASAVSRNFFESRTGEAYNIGEIQTISEGEDIFLYIFILDPIGFIIVSGNDAAMPILGYSFENEFKTEDLPIQLD